MNGAENISTSLRPFIPLVDFLGELLGHDTEVVLQDVKDFSHSVVAIANGHVSGRKVGSPATDLVLRIWQNREYEHRNYLVRYAGYTHEGRPIVSSTFFLRNTEDQVIGFLCINFDNSIFKETSKALRTASDYLDSISSNGSPFPTHHIMKDQSDPDTQTVDMPDEHGNAIIQNDASAQQAFTDGTHETLSVNAEDLTNQHIQSFVAEHRVQPERMNKSERLKLITDLDDSGIFLIKGAIDTVADALGISAPTVYRYLHLIRKEKRENNEQPVE